MLDGQDKLELENEILLNRSGIAMQSSIYIYGRSFGPDERVVRKAREFIFKDKIPGLTATCLKVLVDFWGLNGEYIHEMEGYLDYSQYNEWYDEVIVSSSYFIRNPGKRTESINSRLTNLLDQALENHDTALIEILEEEF